MSERRTSPCCARWVLADTVDVGPSQTTHRGATGCDSRLGRVYLFSPPWALMQMRVQAKVLLRAEFLQAGGVSDHAPVVRSFADFGLRRRRSAPVPRCVIDSVEFEAAQRCCRPSSPKGVRRSMLSAIGRLS